MKNLIAAAFALMFLTGAAHASSYPAYTKDKSAWWVSAMFLGPVLILDTAGRALEATGKASDSFNPLHAATAGIAKNAAGGLCVVPAVGTICK